MPHERRAAAGDADDPFAHGRPITKRERRAAGELRAVQHQERAEAPREAELAAAEERTAEQAALLAPLAATDTTARLAKRRRSALVAAVLHQPIAEPAGRAAQMLAPLGEHLKRQCDEVAKRWDDFQTEMERLDEDGGDAVMRSSWANGMRDGYPCQQLTLVFLQYLLTSCIRQSHASRRQGCELVGRGAKTVGVQFNIMRSHVWPILHRTRGLVLPTGCYEALTQPPEPPPHRRLRRRQHPPPHTCGFASPCQKKNLSKRTSMSRSPRARTDDDAPPTDWLAELPPELHLRILEGVDDFSDCAAFSLASPRLGRLALHSDLPRFKDPLFAVAMRLQLAQRVAAPRRSPRLAASAPAAIPPSPLTESVLRKYAAARRASADHFPWLARVSPALCLSTELDGPGDNRIDIWRLKRGEESGAKLRLRSLRSGQVLHYEGEQGAERLVREEFADGNVLHFEGEQGAERKVRVVLADGNVVHYEGEQGAERMVRTETPAGSVWYYEGESGVERLVRMALADGGVGHCEGEKGAEQVVRVDAA